MTTCDDELSLHLTMPKGNRFGFVAELLGSDDADVAELVAALDQADEIGCHVCEPDGTVVGECDVTTDVDGDDMTIAVAFDDTDEWEVDSVLHFDVQAVGGPLGRYTMFPDSTVTIGRSWTNVEVGS